MSAISIVQPALVWADLPSGVTNEFSVENDGQVVRRPSLSSICQAV